eukprot:CAMPEP_0197624386 /NCGR_PEP_ID=MMETSP1338-20131121/4047_1 /TAXON_ID=43686 ORGANISM="Pelagodinium beii, Strain RCC1491" /NCGR_SAMPLE_ID=MMETSP1338 /ASSEMBLY_ACC=CAM_ASM_000754 /LENGTH=359 /DNA_ID=CAMNT_0043194519 /DNA_START=92 /DNA_END=1171 /DNA_ORIENTATION=-
MNGSNIALDSQVSLDDQVEDIRSRIASNLKVRPGQIALLFAGEKLLDGLSMREALGGVDLEASISVLQQPCQIPPSEYENFIDRDATSAALEVAFIRFEFGHPLVYPDGPVRGFRHGGPPGTPDKTTRHSRFSQFARRDVTTIGLADFPEPRDIHINMMPFIMGEKESLPDEYQHYWPMIENCDLPTEEIGKVGYLTVHESFVKAGQCQRRGGLHIESPGTLVDPAKYTKERYDWGCGIVRHDASKVEGGIYMANNVAGSCRLWNAKITDPVLAAGKLGDMEHMRDVLGDGFDMKPGTIYWLTDATPHENLPVKEDCHRQFFRLVTSSLSAWYPEHCTANPLASPDPAVTKIVAGSKFD